MAYNIVASTDGMTVVSEYIKERDNETSYQSEADLEESFIKQLQGQGYEYLTIHTSTDLVNNLREKLEKLNNYEFTDSEWNRFFDEVIANPNDGIQEKTKKLQEGGSQQLLMKDDGQGKNIILIDKDDIHRNSLQVINQYVISRDEGAKRDNRYDVTILVNGLPLVHCELKRRGVAIKQAFIQIESYQRQSFWANTGLYEYVQLFIISNGTHTKYYSNSTRKLLIDSKTANRNKTKLTSNGFEFTSYWADAKNRAIPDLVDFTRTFLTKHTLLNILTKYCVFTSDERLLVMRPYQIVATEKILQRINVSSNYKTYGSVQGGGYVWHTTGSGKTLTSFKTAQLATQLEGIDKVLFVVDRKDLDYQTMREYDKFQKGAANSNTSTKVLEEQLANPDDKIIITTIQKLERFCSKYKNHKALSSHIVIIFDECHRSQFGKMHTTIKNAFSKYHLFGFTGTPIFSGTKTTDLLFGDRLHTYTIVDAINDGNVLPFRIDYITVIRMKDDVKDVKVKAIDKERALHDDEYIKKVVDYVLENYDRKTKRDKNYTLTKLQNIADTVKNKGKEMKALSSMKGFNSIFVADSIPMAKRYYDEFKERDTELRIATIFSYARHEEEFDDESFDIESLDKTSRDFLDAAIKDYDEMFGTSYQDTNNSNFQNYYKDVSLRMKNREIDMLIVVNMFLTGFDAPTLNTLWVDKNMKEHGLIQAFSRTNRILNNIKTYGNIVCFRPLQEEVDKAIGTFGNPDAAGIVLLKDFNSYYNGYDDEAGHHEGYTELIERLREDFPYDEPLVGHKQETEFAKLYGAILRLRNILTAFDDFEKKKLMSEREMQNYQAVYVDLYTEMHDKDPERENINNDIVFEVELIKQVEVDIDYILELVDKYRKTEDKEVVVHIQKAIDSTIHLRSKKDLILKFIGEDPSDDMQEQWREYLEQAKEKELNQIIADENLKEQETKEFIEMSFRLGILKTMGTDIDELLPPISWFDKTRLATKERITQKLLTFFEKYYAN